MFVMNSGLAVAQYASLYGHLYSLLPSSCRSRTLEITSREAVVILSSEWRHYQIVYIELYNYLFSIYLLHKYFLYSFIYYYLSFLRYEYEIKKYVTDLYLFLSFLSTCNDDITVHVTTNIPQNIQPIERIYPPCCKYKVGSLHSFCIKIPYKCNQFHAKEKGGIFE